MDSRDNRRMFARLNSRFEEILRFVVFLVEHVVDRKIKINPFAEAFGEREIDHVVAGGSDRTGFAIEAVA